MEQHQSSKFLREAATHFEQRDTHGEDNAHWSNVYNAKNCREAANLIDTQQQEISRLQGLLNKLQINGKPTRKERRAALHAQS